MQDISRQYSPETVYLLEHPHIFTIGRGGRSDNLLSDKDREGNPIELVRINRGGDVTYHGPGQLVVYPHLDLRFRGRDVHRYLRGLEESVILTSRQFGVEALSQSGTDRSLDKQGETGLDRRRSTALDHDAWLGSESQYGPALFPADSPLRNSGLSSDLDESRDWQADGSRRSEGGL